MKLPGMWFVTHMGDARPPTIALLGECGGDEEYLEGQELNWLKQATAEGPPSVRYGRQQERVRSEYKESERMATHDRGGEQKFMDEWHGGQGDAKETSQLKRGAVEGQATVKTRERTARRNMGG